LAAAKRNPAFPVEVNVLDHELFSDLLWL